MLKKTEGIIIDTKNYSETSKIVFLLSKDFGLISLMAKGSRSLKSDLRSSTEKLSYGIFNINYKEDKISTLISIDIINGFKNIKKDIYKISYASFLLDLTNQVFKQNNNFDIYKILISSLLKINDNFNPLIITNIVELKYLSYLGVMPILDKCSKCSTKNNIITLSSRYGGYLCKNCLNGEKIVNINTVKLLRMFYYVDISKISNLDIKESIQKEINSFLDEYYNQYTGLYLKSKEFIKSLDKIKI